MLHRLSLNSWVGASHVPGVVQFANVPQILQMPPSRQYFGTGSAGHAPGVGDGVGVAVGPPPPPPPPPLPVPGVVSQLFG